MNNTVKKVFSIGEDLFAGIYNHLLKQSAGEVLPFIDAMRAIVAQHSAADAAAALQKPNDAANA